MQSPLKSQLVSGRNWWDCKNYMETQETQTSQNNWEPRNKLLNWWQIYFDNVKKIFNENKKGFSINSSGQVYVHMQEKEIENIAPKY